MRIWLMAACAALLPGMACAAPAILPVRDVQVDYDVSAPGQPAQSFTLNYDAADELARIAPASGAVYLLANLPAGQAQLVVPALQAVVQAPDFSALTDMIGHAESARFTPLHADHYAGRACETYLVMDAQGTGTACISADGVVLHFAGQDARGKAEITATSVTFGKQPAADFARPPGFGEITLPPGAVVAMLRGQ